MRKNGLCEFMEWCDRHPRWTKLGLAVIIGLVVVLSIAVEAIGMAMGVFVFLGLIALAFWAGADIIYSLIFE